MGNYYSTEYLKKYSKMSNKEREKDYYEFQRSVYEILKAANLGNLSISLSSNGTVLVSRVPIKSYRVNWSPELLEKWVKED